MKACVPLLVLIGPPGAGKTRIGKRVAKLLEAEFIDTDQRIVAEHGEISALFAKDGEAYFRRIERAVVGRSLVPGAVVSLGGGAILDEQTQHDLEPLRVALLTVNADAIADRITGQNRPLLKDGGVAAWQALADSRREIYERLSTRTWDTSRLPVERLAAEMADWVRSDAASELQQQNHAGHERTGNN
ncbi:MAG: shikimate kinase [Homoserinimonas sp.]|nr:shikimate kinase [Homoserinimonas sp.]